MGVGRNGNLIPFVKGQPSANPSGRRRKTQRERDYEDMVRGTFREVFTPDKVREVFEALLADATKRGKNYRAKELVLNHALGKPTVKVQHTSTAADRLDELLDAMPDVIAVPVTQYSEIEAENAEKED